MRVLTWNLFHGRSRPPAGRGLLREFATALEGWAWDVALLQEVPPWWPPRLGAACGAQQRMVLTSRNSLLPLRRAVSSRNPDLLKSGGGGASAILVRGRIGEHRTLRLRCWPERRWAHGVRLGGGEWVANLHATTRSESRTTPRNREDCAKALAAAREWAAGAPLIFGGDLNLRRVDLPGMRHVAGHYVDHLLVAGLEPAGRAEVLDRGALSDHAPVAIDLRSRQAIGTGP